MLRCFVIGILYSKMCIRALEGFTKHDFTHKFALLSKYHIIVKSRNFINTLQAVLKTLNID